MNFGLTPAILEQRMSDQQRLAELATGSDVAAMHRALALFYHEQLVRTLMESGIKLDMPPPDAAPNHL